MGIAGRVFLGDTKILSDDWYLPKRTTFKFLRADESWKRQSRETYDRGNAVTMLLYDPDRLTVLLTLQFRYPDFVNGHDDLMIEAPAGLLDQAVLEDRIRAEVQEKTGFRVNEVRAIFDSLMSTGSVTERLHFFVGRYSAADKVADGGGNADEGKDIEHLEPTIEEALDMISEGLIRDDKTIRLLRYAALHLFPVKVDS
ncbi:MULTISPECIES: GDP-mannose pyrophosphatase [unclassified Rhizobium]|uniref:GDP-mannose pyrophosphatase n=1 Tax=unclassified Rhizobium TaxID=2613769 RepID=UPI0006F49248|nr:MULTISPECIES: GDP-mannose pyrophosphatase [unclassified Rhizobium]KQV37068.1 GDP-mannose pyrophosphatase [Rhizobium sp. Root1212]KRD28650.1 GDP-mannose pyrophosphatase [Rhizobium sp. Root268]